MSENTALVLAGLSHQGFLPVVVATACCAALNAVVRKSPSRAGRTAAGILFAASLAVFFVAMLHVGCAALVAHQSQCTSNMKALPLALLTYAQDNDETFPPAARWADTVKLGAVGESLHCPASESPYGYGMNRALGGFSLSKLDQPANTVLLFDAETAVRSFAGGMNDVARQRHSGSPNLAFADGHVKRIGLAPLDQWLWTPVESK